MHTFIVQMRLAHGGPLVHLAKLKAKNERGAFRQALEILACNELNAVELIATKDE